MRLEQLRLKKVNETGLPYINITLSYDEQKEFKNGFNYIQNKLMVLGKYIATLYFIYDVSDSLFPDISAHRSAPMAALSSFIVIL